jgi:hypothetical protein
MTAEVPPEAVEAACRAVWDDPAAVSRLGEQVWPYLNAAAPYIAAAAALRIAQRIKWQAEALEAVGEPNRSRFYRHAAEIAEQAALEYVPLT